MSLQQAYGLGTYHFNGGSKQTENRYVTTRENMITAMKKGVKIHCKEITTQVFTVVGLLVELGTDISK